MHDRRDAVRHDGPIAVNTRSESELATLVDIYGLSLLDEPGQLLRLLSRSCPAEPKQTAALLAALGAGIPQRLRGAKDDERLPDLLDDSVRRLRERGTFDVEWAGWAVRAWAHALALPTRALDDDPVAVDPPIADTVPAAAARVAATIPERASRPVVKPAPTRHPTPSPPGTLRAATFRPTSVARAPRPRREPAFVPDPDDVAGTPAVPEAAETPIFVEPLFPEYDPHPLLRGNADAPGPPAAARHGPVRAATPFVADADVARSETGDDAVVAPPWTRPVDKRGRSRGRTIVIALALVAVGGAALLVYDTMRPGVDGVAGPTAATPATPATVAQAPPPAPAVVPSAAPAPAASGPLEAPAPDTQAPQRAAGAASDAATDVAAAASRGAPADQPEPDSRAAADSAPKRQAATEPPTAERATAARPAITRIDVPRVVEGAPFTVGLTVSGDVGNVASVERRVVDSGGSWPTAKVVTPVSALRRTGAREFGISFRAMDAPAYATLQFTVVGRDGSRSEPKTATITVAGPTRVGDTSTASSAGTSQGPATCTGTTCGTVVEAREVEPEVGTRGAVYQVVVRLDDRRTVAFTATYRLQAGSRVRIVDGKLLPTG